MSGELLLLPNFDHQSLTPGFPQIGVANRYPVQRMDIPIERPIRGIDDESLANIEVHTRELFH